MNPKKNNNHHEEKKMYLTQKTLFKKYMTKKLSSIINASLITKKHKKVSKISENQ